MALPKGVGPEELEDSHFIAQYGDDVKEYTELLARGYATQVAAVRTWGPMFSGVSCFELIRAIERNKYLRERLEARLKTITFEEMWNSKSSVHELLQLVRNPDFVKDAVRLNAIKELNVMAGITLTDENGKTKAGRSLADFYADQAATEKRALPSEEPLPGDAKAAPIH